MLVFRSASRLQKPHRFLVANASLCCGTSWGVKKADDTLTSDSTSSSDSTSEPLPISLNSLHKSLSKPSKNGKVNIRKKSLESLKIAKVGEIFFKSQKQQIGWWVSVDYGKRSINSLFHLHPTARKSCTTPFPLPWIKKSRKKL